MMITAVLPKDRIGEGTVTWDGAADSYACRGKADNQNAIDHGNPSRDPRQAWGDHPDGVYNVPRVITCTPDQAHTYGPYKLALYAVSGDGKARQDSEGSDWDGLEGHGGDLQPDGVHLRATYGCLRMHNSTVIMLAAAVNAALANGESVTYTCTSN